MTDLIEKAPKRRSHWLGWVALVFAYLAAWVVSLALLLFFGGLLAFGLLAYLPLSYFVARSAERRDFWQNTWRAILVAGVPSVLLMAILGWAIIGGEGGLTPTVVFIGAFFIVSGAGIGGWAMTEVMFPEEPVGQ